MIDGTQNFVDFGKFPEDFDEKTLQALDIPKGIFKYKNSKWMIKSAITSPFKIVTQKMIMKVNDIQYVYWRLPKNKDSEISEIFDGEIYVSFIRNGMETQSEKRFLFVPEIYTFFEQIDEEMYVGVWGHFNTLKWSPKEMYYQDRDTPKNAYQPVGYKFNLYKKSNAIRVFTLSKLSICTFLSISVVDSYIETFTDEKLFSEDNELIRCVGLKYNLSLFDYFNMPSDILVDRDYDSRHPLDVFRDIKGIFKKVFSVSIHGSTAKTIQEIINEKDLDKIIEGMRYMIVDCFTCQLVLSLMQPDIYMNVCIQVPMILNLVFKRVSFKNIPLKESDDLKLALDKYIPNDLRDYGDKLDGININKFNSMKECPGLYSYILELMNNRLFRERFVYRNLIQDNENLLFRVKFGNIFKNFNNNKIFQQRMVSYIAMILFNVVYLD